MLTLHGDSLIRSTGNAFLAISLIFKILSVFTKFYEIITLENMKADKIFELDNAEDPLTFTKLISLYEWLVEFFQEKYD